ELPLWTEPQVAQRGHQRGRAQGSDGGYGQSVVEARAEQKRGERVGQRNERDDSHKLPKHESAVSARRHQFRGPRESSCMRPVTTKTTRSQIFCTRSATRSRLCATHNRCVA